VIEVLFLLQSVSELEPQPELTKPNLLEFASIVGPVAECEYLYEERKKSLSARWLKAHQFEAKQSGNNRYVAEPGTPSGKLMTELRELRQEIQKECRVEEVRATIRARLKALNPTLPDSNAFWFARQIYSSLNNLNRETINYRTGNLPAPPPPPTSFSPQKKTSNAKN